MLTVSEAAALLRSFDRVLILTHIRPDGDTVGCAAGLCAALRAMGKTAYLLPNPGLTENTAPYFTPYSAPADFVPEKVVSTDIATVGLFPDNAKSYADKVDLAIDHHPSFEGFGKANIVRPEAAACGELILDIGPGADAPDAGDRFAAVCGHLHGHRRLHLLQRHRRHSPGRSGADGHRH